MEPTPTASLQAARDEMSRLSLAILDLLNARAQCALRIGRLKDERGWPIRDPRREAQLIEWLASRNEGPFDAESVRMIFRAILDASVSLMERERPEPATPDERDDFEAGRADVRTNATECGVQFR